MTFLERGNVGKATTLLAGTRVVQHYSGVPSIVRKLLLIVQAGLQESLGHTGKPYVCVTFRMRPCKKGWRICAHHVRFIAQFHQGNSYECHKAATERATQSVTRSGSHMTKSLMLAGLSDMAMDERISAHLSELPTWISYRGKKRAGATLKINLQCETRECQNKRAFLSPPPPVGLDRLHPQPGLLLVANIFANCQRPRLELWGRFHQHLLRKQQKIVH